MEYNVGGKVELVSCGSYTIGPKVGQTATVTRVGVFGCKLQHGDALDHHIDSNGNWHLFFLYGYFNPYIKNDSGKVKQLDISAEWTDETAPVTAIEHLRKACEMFLSAGNDKAAYDVLGLVIDHE